MSLATGDRERIIEMYRAGKKTADITKETGASRSTIYFVLREEGVVPHRRSGPRTGTVPRSSGLAPQDHQQMLDWALERVIQLEAETATLRERLRVIVEVARE